MPGNEDTVFSSKTEYKGIFSFNDFYKFCYLWLKEEPGLDVTENKYSEKIAGDAKEIKVEWECTKKVTDYFKFKVKVEFRITGLVKVDINQEGAKISTNSGTITINLKGILIKDYEGKFEKSAFGKFWRDIYEKWVIPSRINQLQEDLSAICDEFLAQSKAWLDLEGRR